MNSTGSDEPGAGRTGSSPRRSGFWLLAGLLFLAAFGVAVLVVDRRGARILAPPPSPSETARSAMPELSPSTVSLEIHHDLAPVRNALEDRIPVRFGDLDERRIHPDNPRISYAVAVEREPLEMELRGDTARLTVVVRYRGRAWFDSPFGGEVQASCGGADDPEARPRAIVRLASPLEIRPDWHIASRIRVEEVRSASGSERDRCEVALGPLRMDATDPLLAMAEARIREMTDELDAGVRELDFRSVVESHWSRIQDPVRLADGVWLQIEPDSIRVGPVGGRGPEGQMIVARLALLGRPRIMVGARPLATRVPLPDLEEGAVEERSRVIVESRIGYSAASRMASEALRGRELTVGGRDLRLGDVAISAVGDGRLAVGLDLEGAVRGRVYLVGTPVLDPATDEVTVPDLGFSVETRNVLLRGAAWLVRGTVPERVRRVARWDATDALERIRALAARELDRSLGGGLRLEGSLGRIEMLGVHVSEEGLVLRSSLTGALRIRGTASSAGERTTDGVGDDAPRAEPGGTAASGDSGFGRKQSVVVWLRPRPS